MKAKKACNITREADPLHDRAHCVVDARDLLQPQRVDVGRLQRQRRVAFELRGIIGLPVGQFQTPAVASAFASAARRCAISAP